MGTLRVKLRGESMFIWKGDEREVCDLADALGIAAGALKSSVEDFAADVMRRLPVMGLVENDQDIRQVQVMAIAWYVLSRDTGNADHPGRFADYIGAWDFDFDLAPTRDGYTVKVAGSTRFDS